jgi:N-acylneuraminate cytidylyltransferase
VFTNNAVYVDENGTESVKCSRSDGYGIKLLKTAISIGILDLKIAIISTEKNKIVCARANKLELDSYPAISNKLQFLRDVYFPSINVDPAIGFKNLIYLGNDLNDLAVIKIAGYSFAPSNCHPELRKYVSKIIKVGPSKPDFIRSVIEFILGRKRVLEIVNLTELREKN